MATTSGVGPQSPTQTFNPLQERPLWQRMWRARVSYIMLLAFFIPFIIFHLYPIASSAYLSLTDYTGSPTAEIEFLALENFQELISFEIRSLPRLLDEDSGEIMYQCGRSRIPASEYTTLAVAEQAECQPAFERARNVLSEGYSEWRPLFETHEYRLIIGATDPRFWTAMYNTVLFVVITVFARVIVGLGLALLLQQQSTINMLLRTVFFLPSVTAGVAVTVVWGWIFRGQAYGLVNSIRLGLGAEEVIAFLSDPAYMLPIVMLLTIWGGIGYNMILYLAGLQSIPESLYEAATVDGASTRQKFFYITLPLLRPTTIFLIITGIIGSFQVFDAVYILFNQPGASVGGTLDAALTVVGYLYERGFRLFQLGYASAIAWVLFIVIFILTLVNLRVGRANEAY